ncbi:MAG: hypothetical protein M1814_000722 [Vezdaea aestivalis]|nr:MAG: hypothetical protein M1814_000722 [Vezdaea aestivalis]
MAPYREFFVRRSDGQLTVSVKGSGPVVPNGPTAEQLDATPSAAGVTDYYKEVLPDQLWVLGRLPDNFRLYEHLKYSNKEGDEAPKANRTHARGGNDRQDAYLYGHPEGKKKRYRCPADFYNHLYWLATDSTGDSRNCTCMICSPDDIPRPKAAKANTTNTKEGGSTVGVVIPPLTKQNKDKKPSPSVKSTTPYTLPTPKVQSREREYDTQYGLSLYRLGELVWFSRGASWSLGVVAKRGLYDMTGKWQQATYSIQPVSYPGHNLPPVSIEQANQIRPWLSWSPPQVTRKTLHDKTYREIDWAGVIAGAYGQGVIEIDASVLAAKWIDESYVAFGQISKSPRITSWMGMFLGGEKIWIEDPVSLRPVRRDQSEILVVKMILEQTPESGAANATGETPELILVGDHYIFELVKGATDQSQGPSSQLPQRLLKDIEARNSSTRAKVGEIARWRLVQQKAEMSLGSVKGRWYESETLFPTLQIPIPGHVGQIQQFNQASDANLYLNARCDKSLCRNNMGNRFNTRNEALGGSVPPTFVVSRGLDGSMQDNQITAADGGAESGNMGVVGSGDGLAVTGGQDAGVGGHGDDFNQFMNLD